MYLESMTKKSIIEELQKLESEINSLISYISDKEEMNLPGVLFCSERGNSFEYHQILDDGKNTYISKDNKTLLHGLAKKKHYQKMLSAAEKEKAQIERCLKTLKSGKCLSDIDDVYSSLHKGIRKLCGPFSITDDGYAADWYLDRRKGRNQSREWKGQLVTQKGDVVKSKSELIIASKLDAFEVPYVYEFTTGLNGGDYIFHPDFLVLNKRTHEEYFWEHCGKMDDPIYCTNVQMRMEKYAQNGYFPGKNLILTFETSKLPLSTGYVDMIIKEYLQ